MILGTKHLKGHGIEEPENWHFFVSRSTGQPCATAGKLGTGHQTGAHTGTVGKCADAIEAGVCANGSARIQTGTGSG